MISYETIGKLIDRLTADAHNETGQIREYARSLLADLDMSMPADPEMSPRHPKGTPEYAKYETGLESELGKWVRGEGEYARPDPFDAVPVLLDLSDFGKRPFESSYGSRCRVRDDYIDEGELIIKTPDGYAHLNCARDEYPDEIAEIEKRNA